MELDKEGGHDGQAQPLLLVGDAHGLGVQNLDGRGIQAAAQGLIHGAGGAVQRRERAGHRDNALGEAGHAHGNLGDDAQRALGAHKEIHQIVPAAGFGGVAADAQHLTAGEDHLQAEDIVAGDAVLDRAHAARVVADHPPDGGHFGTTGRRREEHALATQLLVQLGVDHPRLHHDLKITLADLEDLVHAIHGQEEPSVARHRVPLEARTGAPGDDRHTLLLRPGEQRRDLVGGGRPDNYVGAAGTTVGLVNAMGVQVGVAGGYVGSSDNAL